MKLFKRFRALISDTSRSLRERVFIMLTLIALAILFLALVGDIVYGENIAEILASIITLIAVPVTTYLAVTRDKIEIASRVLSLCVVFVILPISFLFGGGVNGGTVPWLIFSYLVHQRPGRVQDPRAACASARSGHPAVHLRPCHTWCGCRWICSPWHSRCLRPFRRPCKQ